MNEDIKEEGAEEVVEEETLVSVYEELNRGIAYREFELADLNEIL